MASRYWGGPRHIIGLNAGHGIYVTSCLVNPITGIATAWGSPMVTGLCLIQIEQREKSQASFNSHLILTQTVLRVDVICITGKKGTLPFQCPSVCVCTHLRVCEVKRESESETEWKKESEREQEQCCNRKCIVGLYMHMLRDKRSHTDQQTGNSVAAHSCILLFIYRFKSFMWWNLKTIMSLHCHTFTLTKYKTILGFFMKNYFSHWVI